MLRALCRALGDVVKAFRGDGTLSASRRRDRPLPPAPEAHAEPPTPLKFLQILRSNAIAAFSRKHFERPVVVSTSILGTAAVVSDPDAIRHILIDNAECR
ncbi:MAG: hypothetical protein WD099_08110 [Dongiaceae bacterium]